MNARLVALLVRLGAVRGRPDYLPPPMELLGEGLDAIIFPTRARYEGLWDRLCNPGGRTRDLTPPTAVERLARYYTAADYYPADSDPHRAEQRAVAGGLFLQAWRSQRFPCLRFLARQLAACSRHGLSFPLDACVRAAQSPRLPSPGGRAQRVVFSLVPGGLSR